jgi:hypothetical protein
MKIISIGCKCETAFFIKDHFKREYYPFDWIWSTIDFVINTFETDYFEFTECEKLSAVWNPPNDHTYIFNNNCDGGENRIATALSVHDADFPLCETDALNKEAYIPIIPSINEKYKRRFARLYETLNSGENIILIRRVLDKTQGAIKKDYDSNEKINYLSNLLSSKFKSNITICVFDDEGFIDGNTLNDNVKLFNSFGGMASFIKDRLDT